MAILNLNFSSVPSREPLEEGFYVLMVSKVEEKKSSTGNPMLSIEFDVKNVEGNRKVFDNFVLIEKSLWKVKEFFEALGMDASSIVEIDTQELVGLELQAKVIQEEYQGDILNRVKKYRPL